MANLGLDVLLVSQFTLYGTLNKKHQPDYKLAMEPSVARELYNELVASVRTSHKSGDVREGVFGANMDVALVNDGPVTLVIDSPATNAVPSILPDSRAASELEVYAAPPAPPIAPLPSPDSDQKPGGGGPANVK